MEKTKEFKKRKKGITLVALVVTIIVLLILAGIVINLSIGNNGLFTRAGSAANIWKKLDTNEQEEMKKFENAYDKIANKETDGNVNATLELPYIGTSSFTVNVNGKSTNAKIVKYQYKINDVLITETEESKCTIKDLNPSTTYKLAVTAIDEQQNEITEAIEVTTKDRLYIIKDGKQQFKDKTELTTDVTVVEENDYCKITFPAITRGFYKVNEDINEYSKIFIDMSCSENGSNTTRSYLVAWSRK